MIAPARRKRPPQSGGHVRFFPATLAHILAIPPKPVPSFVVVRSPLGGRVEVRTGSAGGIIQASSTVTPSVTPWCDPGNRARSGEPLSMRVSAVSDLSLRSAKYGFCVVQHSPPKAPQTWCLRGFSVFCRPTMGIAGRRQLGVFSGERDTSLGVAPRSGRRGTRHWHRWHWLMQVGIGLSACPRALRAPGGASVDVPAVCVLQADRVARSADSARVELVTLGCRPPQPVMRPGKLGQFARRHYWLAPRSDDAVGAGLRRKRATVPGPIHVWHGEQDFDQAGALTRPDCRSDGKLPFDQGRFPGATAVHASSVCRRGGSADGSGSRSVVSGATESRHV